MTNVLRFPDPDAKKPHRTGNAQCRLIAEHAWVGTQPIEGNPWLLECPRGCGMTGHFVGVFPEDPIEAKRWMEESWRMLWGNTHGA